MNNQPKLLAVLTSAAFLAGCASGGGGGGGDPGPRPTSSQKQTGGNSCGIYAIFDLWGACAPSDEEKLESKLAELGLRPTSTPAFTSWSQLPPEPRGYYSDVSYQFDTMTASVAYSQSPARAAGYSYESCVTHVRHGRICSGTVTVPATEGTIANTSISAGVSEYRTYGPNYEDDRSLRAIFRFNKFDQLTAFESLQAIGQGEIDFVHKQLPLYEIREIESRTKRTPPFTPFSEVEAHEVALAANPYKLGWNYQSFGVWDLGSHISLQSFGAATPASAVPLVGQATFTGKLAGFYVSPSGQGSMAAAEVNVKADFSARSLSFASSGTTVSRDAKTATAAPNLNLSGTLAYSPASNTFTGTLTNAGGTMSGSSTGRYYGPAAQELGGVFSVKSPATVETFAGAYGAKR